jgi:hypothetical protein
MAILSTPLIDEPVFTCAKLVLISGCLPNAEVTIFAVAMDMLFSSSVLIGTSQASSTSPQVYEIDDTKITVGTKLYVIQKMTQSDGSQQESPQPSDDGTNIPYITVQNALSVEAPHIDAPLVECALCIRVKGILPGAMVEVSASVRQTLGEPPKLRTKIIGQTPTFSSDTDVSIEPLKVGQTIDSRQWLCDQNNTSAPSLAVSVSLVPKHDKTFLQIPEISEPIFPCQEYIGVTNCLPGAQIELFVNNEPDVGATGCATTPTTVIWPSNQLREGDTLQVQQTLCDGELVSELSPPDVKVVSSQLLPQPGIISPLYEGDTIISLQATVSGEIVTIEGNDQQIGMGGSGGSETTLSMSPVKEGMRIVAKVTLCDGSKTSRPVYVLPRPEKILPPTVERPVFACTQHIGITNFLPGAKITVYAAQDSLQPMEIGVARLFTGGVATITPVVFLKKDWQIYATQEIGGILSDPSDSVTVQEIITLPPFTVHKKLFTCAHCLLVENVVPGSRVDVYQNSRWIGGTYTTDKTAQIAVAPSLEKVPPITLNQQVCSLTNSIVTQVDSDALIRIPTIIEARPDSFSVTVTNVFPGAIVEIVETTRYNSVIGRGCLADVSGTIPLEVPLVLGDSVIARQTMCAPSDYSQPFVVNEPSYWPLGQGPYAVGSIEVDNIPIGSELQVEASGFSFLQNGNLGIIHYPSTVEGGNVLANGAFPLIAFAHAKNPDGSVEAVNQGFYLRYDYRQLNTILKHLASWGFVCIASSMFWASPGGDKREYLLRDEINYMFAKNHSDPMFHNKINENQLAIMGHSTGGWGALTLATSTLSGLVEVALKIKAVALIAPAVWNDQWSLARQISPRPLIVLDGTEDISGDGAGPAPRGIFDHAIPPKIYVRITGANHFGYTDSLTDVNDGNPGQILPREEQQTIAIGYLTAFFTRFLNNNRDEEAYLRGRPIETLEGYTILVESQF